jgi:hypothetical protein
LSRRVSLPAADDLFRPTASPDLSDGVAPSEQGDASSSSREETAPPAAPAPEPGPRRPSGRVRHDEKMTVYVTAAELLDLEQARLRMRAEHGVAVDRGRLVREAIAIALADLELRGDDSVLVQRLRES